MMFNMVREDFDFVNVSVSSEYINEPMQEVVELCTKSTGDRPEPLQGYQGVSLMHY